MNKTNIIAEIGINHNGDLNVAKKLIDVAGVAGCDYVKFQKRTPGLCVPEDQKSKIRQTPWGEMTYIEYKERTEFGKDEYDEIDLYCQNQNIKWFASVWDIESVKFMSNYTDITKVPSALITDENLLLAARESNDYFMFSTGMSNEKDIELAVKVGDPDLLFHTNSTYPCPVDELNLNYIKWLKEKYPTREIGYSGHEYGLVPTFVAVSLGVTWVERHVTLDRMMWGSDHMASIEPGGLIKMTKGIRDIEKTFGVQGPREILGGELSKLKSLRGMS
jgi:N-acetylneuraminate synthase